MTALSNWMPNTQAIATLRTLADELKMAEGVAELVYWDERVMMPHATAAHRAQQRAWLEKQVDALRTAPQLRVAIDDVLSEDSDNAEALALQGDLVRTLKLPASWRSQAADITSRARSIWDDARINDDFASFLPNLRELLASQQELAHALNPDAEPYEVLLNEWEPGVSPTLVEQWFGEAETTIRSLISIQGETLMAPEPSILDNQLTETHARQLEHALATAVGYNWSSGRSDPSTRAFCIHLAPHDVRITSRFGVHRKLGTLHSSLHELGHGIYAQALGRLGVPTTLAAAPGLGVDESQSRLIENLVGRNQAFWEYHIHTLADCSSGAVSHTQLSEWVDAIQTPRNRFLRVGADELTYGLHVILRFRLERAMVNGELDPADLPDAWRAGAQELFGIEPPSDREGCLQDVHWSIGQWGYFPTYLLGTMHASSLYEQAVLAVPQIEDEMRVEGTCTQLNSWLDQNMYRHGRAHQPLELIATAINAQPSPRAYLDHLTQLYSAVP